MVMYKNGRWQHIQFNLHLSDDLMKFEYSLYCAECRHHHCRGCRLILREGVHLELYAALLKFRLVVLPISTFHLGLASPVL